MRAVFRGALETLVTQLAEARAAAAGSGSGRHTSDNDRSGTVAASADNLDHAPDDSSGGASAASGGNPADGSHGAAAAVVKGSGKAVAAAETMDGRSGPSAQ